MVSAFPLASTIPQTKSICHIRQRHIGGLYINGMHPLVVCILQVLIKIMTCFYAGKLEGLMAGGRDESLLLSNTMAEHPTLLSSAANKI